MSLEIFKKWAPFEQNMCIIPGYFVFFFFLKGHTVSRCTYKCAPASMMMLQNTGLISGQLLRCGHCRQQDSVHEARAARRDRQEDHARGQVSGPRAHFQRDIHCDYCNEHFAIFAAGPCGKLIHGVGQIALLQRPCGRQGHHAAHTAGGATSRRACARREGQNVSLSLLSFSLKSQRSGVFNDSL